MQIRVLVDVCLPLKRTKKIKRPGRHAKMVTFNYEPLDVYYYLCGRLGHLEGLCAHLFNMGPNDGSPRRGPELGVELRGGGGATRSKWLREEGHGEWYGATNTRE